MVTVVMKALRRQHVAHNSSDAADEVRHASVGEVVSLVTGDSYNLAQWFWDGLANSISAPIEVVVTIFLLYSILGVSTFASLAVFLVFTAAGIPIAQLQLKLNRLSLRAKDHRVALISEIVTGIRLLKTFGLSAIWFQKAKAARQRELVLVWRGALFDAAINLLTLLLPGSMVIAAFYTYTKVLHRELTVPAAFTTLSFYGL
jgi:ABC-type multidrug transport system fused ATPase/permease subunit